VRSPLSPDPESALSHCALGPGGQEGADRRPDHRRRLGQCRRHGTGFSTQFCDVEVDPETGKVTILRFVAAQDVGCAIHPSYVEGQIQGGVAQGIGWALNEEYIYDRNGRHRQPCNRHNRIVLSRYRALLNGCEIIEGIGDA
jgi:CO/xanthine dehydrogenase Mo-binding subunit